MTMNIHCSHFTYHGTHSDMFNHSKKHVYIWRVNELRPDKKFPKTWEEGTWI